MAKTKVCCSCKYQKPLKQFNKKSSLENTKYYAKCKRCQNNIMTSKYGITLEDYRMLFETQHGRCKICLKSDHEEGRMLAVDHCHLTGKVRGLLCYNCNSMLGRFNDSTAFLKRCIDYLEDNL